jgi:hypothetical protein
MATKEPEPTYTIYMEWTGCNTDPTSYKVLSPNLHPLDLRVAIEVPVKYFKDYDVDSHSGTLTPDGMAFASRQIALAITRIYAQER